MLVHGLVGPVRMHCATSKAVPWALCCLKPCLIYAAWRSALRAQTLCALAALLAGGAIYLAGASRADELRQQAAGPLPKAKNKCYASSRPPASHME
jgi:hypothetical protein